MPVARNRWQRCNQALAWAKTEMAVPKETRIVVLPKVVYKKDECAGLTGRGGRNDGMVITLSSSLLPNKTCAIIVLLHEIAHAILYDDGLGILHGARFHEVHGDLCDRWEHHGELDSLSFPVI